MDWTARWHRSRIAGPLRGLSRLRRHLVLLVWLAIAFTSVRAQLGEMSPTMDEWAHFTRGVAWWKAKDSRLSVAHPPLANLWAGWFVYDDPRLLDPRKTKGWKDVDAGRSSRQIAKHDYAAARELLFEARRGMTWIFLFGITYVYAWCNRMLGWRVAVVAAGALACNPLLIGQATYVTTDLACGVAFAVVAGELARHVDGKVWWAGWLTLPIALGVALVTKHSGLVAIPIATVVVIGAAIVRNPTGVRLRRRVARAVAQVAFGAVIVLGIDLAAYRFQDSGLTVQQILRRPEPKNYLTKRHKGKVLEKFTPLAKLNKRLRIPLPYTQIMGLAQIRVQADRGHAVGQLFGKKRERGELTYFPIMLAIKTPIAIAAGLGLGIWLWLRRRARPSVPTIVVGLVGVAFLMVAMRSNIALGVRHAMPTLWCLTVVAAAGFVAAWQRTTGRLSARVVLLVIAASAVVASATAGPERLGYANPFIGRRLGAFVSALGDDWRQDRVALAEVAARENLTPLYYDGGTELQRYELEHLDLDYTNLRCSTKIRGPAWVAIHASHWYINRHRCWKAIRDVWPTASVNDHILLFRTE